MSSEASEKSDSSNDQLEGAPLHGRLALVCGASSGIGRATALSMASRGAKVLALARRQAALAELRQEIEDAGGHCEISVCDMENLEAVAATGKRLLEVHGPIEILVNNAGGPPGGPILSAKPEDFEKALRRLLLAGHVLLQQLLPGMEQRGYGRILNVISTSVYEPLRNLGVSNTIRAATAGWAKTLAAELPPGITINNVLPGATDTGRLRSLWEAAAEKRGVSFDTVQSEWLAEIPEGRMADPLETAGVLCFLASPAAAYVRGQSLAVDGGRMRSI